MRSAASSSSAISQSLPAQPGFGASTPGAASGRATLCRILAAAAGEDLGALAAPIGVCLWLRLIRYFLNTDSRPLPSRLANFQIPLSLYSAVILKQSVHASMAHLKRRI